MKKIIFAVVCLVVTALICSSCTTIKPKKKLKPLSEKEIKLLSMMGGKVISNEKIALGKVLINRRTKDVSFPGIVQMTEGAIEVLISTPKGRAYESLLVSDIDPYHLQLALLLSGAENGVRIDQKKIKKKKKELIPQGDIISIFVKTKNGKTVPITKWLINTKSSKPFKINKWVFVGSSFNSQKKCLATKDGNIVTTWSFGNTILDNPSISGDTDDYFNINTDTIPKIKTPVTIILRKLK
jgi:hypothetical protein